MILAHLYVWCSLFTIFCNFPVCSAGNPGSSSNDDVQALNIVLKADRWVLLIRIALNRKFIGTNGEELDVSDLLHTGSDGNIVTPVNYTDKLIKSSTTANCVYSERLKSITDFVIDVIKKKCMALDSSIQVLDCMERFWQTIDLAKSLFESMLKVLYFFYNASKDMCPRTVVDALECILPHYDRQKYNRVNYLNDDGTVKIDDFTRDTNTFGEKIECANKVLRFFIKARCLRVYLGPDEDGFEASLADVPADQVFNTIFDYFDDLLSGSNELLILPDPGHDIE